MGLRYHPSEQQRRPQHHEGRVEKCGRSLTRDGSFSRQCLCQVCTSSGISVLFRSSQFKVPGSEPLRMRMLHSDFCPA